MLTCRTRGCNSHVSELGLWMCVQHSAVNWCITHSGALSISQLPPTSQMTFYRLHPPCHCPGLCSAVWSGPPPVWPSRGCFCASLVLNSSQSALTVFHDRVSALSEKPHLMPRKKGPLPTTCMSVPTAINIPGKRMPGHILLATPGLRVPTEHQLTSSLSSSFSSMVGFWV